MSKKKGNAVLRVFQTAKCRPVRYLFGVIFSAGGILLSGVPFYTVYRIVRIFLTAGLESGKVNGGEAWLWTGVTIGCIALGIVLSVVGSALCHASAFDALYELRMRILDHMGKLNLGFFTSGRSGAVQKMMNENIDKMESIIAHDFPNIVGAALLLIALAVLMFSLNVVLALTVFAALMIAFIIQFSAFGGKSGQKIWADLTNSATELDAVFSEYVSGMEEEKIFGRPEAAAKRLTGKVLKSRDNWLVYLKRVTPIFGAYKTITESVLAFILIVGCILLSFHAGDHGLMMEVLMFMIVGPAVINPLMELVELWADLRNLAARMDQIDTVLSMKPLPEGTLKAPEGQTELSFCDVSFSYQSPDDPGYRMAVDHVSMDIPAGSFVALAGPSGGGKSTAGQLLARFWDVDSGSITIGGYDIRRFTFESLMDTVAFVFQDTYIFAGSVSDNITMHRPASQKEVEAAAKAARCHEFILSFPQGYDTKLGDGGHKLSGGEAQRIAIARAILKNAPIVVLDEALAFTDAENELALREGMAELLQGKTVLMIAHRLYSIQGADRIFVMENGRVKESGTHDELLGAGGLYAHLWKIQNETEKWQMKGGRAYV